MRQLRVALLVVSLSAALAAAAQNPRDTRAFRSGIEITAVTATVVDGSGRLVARLPREAFEVYEDGERQTVTQFTNERVPVSLGILLDISDSMYGQRIKEARSAIERFLFELLNDRDEFFIEVFNHAPRIITPWTHDAGVVGAALGRLQPFGGTAEYDAVLRALPFVQTRSRARGALLVITDGADTASDATLQDVRSALFRSDAFVYAIAIDSSERQTINTRVNPGPLQEITAQTGGRTEIVTSSADLAGATARIAEELNGQYLLGYTPPHPPDGKFHSLRVRIVGHAADYRVRARNGYVALSPSSIIRP